MYVCTYKTFTEPNRNVFCIVYLCNECKAGGKITWVKLIKQQHTVMELWEYEIFFLTLKLFYCLCCVYVATIYIHIQFLIFF